MPTLMLNNHAAKGQMLTSEASSENQKAEVSEKKGLTLDSSPEIGNKFSGVEGKRVEDLLSKSKSSAAAPGNSVSGIESDRGSLMEHNSLYPDDIAKANRTKIRNDRFRRRSKTPSDFSPLVNGSDIIGSKNQGKTGGPLDQCDKAHQQQKGDERNRLPKISSENIRSAQYPDEGPSNYIWNRKYQYIDGERNRRWNTDGATKVGYLEQNRAEILKMLDELRDQVQRSCDDTDKKKPTDPADKTMNTTRSYVNQDHGNRAPENSSSLNWNPSRRAHLLDEHKMSMLSFYPTVSPQNDIPGCIDPLTYRRAPYNMGDYTQRHADSYLYGQLDHDPVMSYHHEGFYHQPACTCIHCNPRPFSAAEQGPLSICSHRRVPYLANNHEFYPINVPPVFGTRSSITRGGNALHSANPSTDRKTTLSLSARRPCQPVAGAAPFVTCYNCFEMLQLPENTSLLKKHFKVRCGSCSEINTVQCCGNKLVVLVNPQTSHTSLGNYNNSCNSPNNVLTDDKLVLPYIFPVHDRERVEKAHGLDFSGSEKMQGLSSSSSMSGLIDSPECGISQKDVLISSEIPLEAQVVSRVPNFPLHDHFGSSQSDQLIDGCGNGSRSNHSDQERNVFLSGNVKQNSLSGIIQMATEMDLPTDEYPLPGLSQDSCDMVNKDEAQTKIIKAGESFLSNLVKKSFRFNQSSRHGRSKVFINGHHISDRSVKRAEKLAGPIFPGEYWYDYRAGFWGVMGHPCLGIIPPFIEEFKYPMPKNCAGGNTGVLVNGRELHQKDLNLLYRRGFPDSSGSYTIDISGRVWDDDTGEELDCLGRLAPTVEKVKRGFGMRVPRDLAKDADTD